MKKYYKKINQLINDGYTNYSSDVISLEDFIKVYFDGYNESISKIEPLDVSDIIKRAIGIDVSASLNYIPNKIAYASIKDQNDTLDIYFDCHKLSDIYVVSSNYEEAHHKIGDLELYKNILKDTIKDYMQNVKDFEKNYDSSHNVINAININSVLYLVDNEIIVFLSDSSYIDIIRLDDGSLEYDCHGLNEDDKKAIGANLSNIFSKVFINISDAPSFMKEDLYNKRQEQIYNEPNTCNNNNNSCKKVLKRFKK